MAAPQNHHELAGNGFGRVHRVAQSPLGDLWLALDQRSGSPGDPVLLRYVSFSGDATWDTLERVAAAGRAAMSLRNELLLPVVEVLQQGPLAIAYEYIEAQPLSVLQSCARARELRFPVGVSLRLLIDLLLALQLVHESWPGGPTEAPFGGLMPASVMVARDGRMRLCDALVAPAALLQRGFELSAADLAYRAPEQVYASTAPEPSTDVFIASILLWELLSGRRMLSGPKETIERKLLEHDLPRASADLRSDCQLSRGLLELLNSGLSLDASQRPATPGAFATALGHCRHEIASHAQVAEFVNEIAAVQLDESVAILRLALRRAGGADDAQLEAAPQAGIAAQAAIVEQQREFAAQWQELAAQQSEVAAPRWDVAGRSRESGPSSRVAAGAAPPSGVSPGSLASALRRAVARQRALPRETAAGTSVGAEAPPPVRAQPVLASTAASPPLPLLDCRTTADASPAPELEPDAPASSEEQTAVYVAVPQPGGVRSDSPPQPIRLAPKRALLAAMAGVVLLIQLWMFTLARSQPRKLEPEAPRSEASAERLPATSSAEPEPSGERRRR